MLYGGFIVIGPDTNANRLYSLRTKAARVRTKGAKGFWSPPQVLLLLLSSVLSSHPATVHGRAPAMPENNADACIVFRGGLTHAINNLYGQVSEHLTPLVNKKSGDVAKPSDERSQHGAVEYKETKYTKT